MSRNVKRGARRAQTWAAALRQLALLRKCRRYVTTYPTSPRRFAKQRAISRHRGGVVRQEPIQSRRALEAARRDLQRHPLE